MNVARGPGRPGMSQRLAPAGPVVSLLWLPRGGGGEGLGGRGWGLLSHLSSAAPCSCHQSTLPLLISISCF